MKTGTAVCQQLDSNGKEDMDEFDLPGFRFHPTEQELVGFYLKNMVQGKHINLNVIGILDLYRYDPWELPSLGRAEERELFFFVPRDKNGSGRTNRIAISGYWKATGSDKQIVDRHVKCIGVRKTLVFYKGRAPRGQRTDWVMKEYRMPDDHKSKVEAVVCCVYRKATPRKWVEQRALNHVEDQPSGDDDDHDLDCTNKPHETRFSSPEVMDRKLENTGIARSELCTASSFQSAARRETKQISVSTELQIAPDLCQLSAKAEGDCVAHTEASSSTPANNSNIYGDLMIDPAFQAFVEDGECEAFSVCGRDNNLSFMDLLESSSDCSCLQDHPFPASLMDGESHIENQFQQSPGLSIGFFFNEATLYSRLSMAEKYPLNGLWTPPATFEYSCFDQEYMQNNNGSIEL